MSSRRGVSEPLLSAAIIVRDEADHLRECLRSLKGLVDQIVVVDTGSVDDSADVARAAGAVVIHRPWDDDFSAARNAALDGVTGRWVLYIDADERVERTDREAVRARLRRSDDIAAFLVSFEVRVGWTPYPEYRLWRHQKSIRFRGRIHESIVPAVERHAAATGQRITDVPLSIVHYGYEGDLTRKHHRNLPLLEAQIECDPERVYLWNELGVTLSALGRRDDAVEAWRTGTELIERHGIRSPVDVLCAGSLAVALVDDGDDPTSVLGQLERLAPEYPIGWWAAARYQYREGQWELALPWLYRLTAHEDRADFGALSFDPSLFRDWSWDLVGDCLIELGNALGAAEAYERAWRWRPDDLRYRTKAIGAAAAARLGFR